MCEGLVVVTQNKPVKCWQRLLELAGAFGGFCGARAAGARWRWGVTRAGTGTNRL